MRLISCWLLLAPVWVSGGVLTMVPMQGGMVMPMISYDEVEDRLSVMMPVEVPALTPLLVSHPGDWFDPAHPWFTDLDPSAKGLSFSRRYGFVMSGMSDELPANRQIWIRRVSGPAEVKFYRYATSPAPGVWEPIYGTAGSPAARFWNQMMFHPAVTAPPGTNGYTTVFEAYLVDVDTMAELSGSAIPMTLEFTNVPDGRPVLTMGTRVALAWDAGATNYVPEATTDLSSGLWMAVTQSVVVADGERMVLMSAEEIGNRQFRMRREE
ncbi:MAG TPA: hypothetical protein PKE55_07505 [Kiritimatiellia bacterium]|nr:hypothetical protein [Kiritimatiellia bacterium]